MRRKIYILILFIIIGGALSFIYTNSIATINEENFKVMSVQSFETNRVDKYELPEASRASLFEVLTSLETETSIGDAVDRVREFEMVLTNRWGLSWEYRVLYADDMTVYLQDAEGVYEVDNTDFFYSHEWFPDIYSDRDAPEIGILVNDKEVQLQELDQRWKLLRYDGQWVSQQSTSVIPDGEDVGTVSIVSIDDSIEVNTEKQPDSLRLRISNRLTDGVLFDGEVEIDRLPYQRNNGHYDYELTMVWDDATYQGQYVVSFAVIVDLPEILEFSKQEVIQGELLEVVFYNANLEDIYFEQSIYKDFSWLVQGDLLRGYIPTNYNTEAGVYEIKYGSRKTGIESTEEIEVVAHDYRIQYMYIDESIQSGTRNEAAYEEFAKYFTPVRKESVPTRYYSEPFVIPVKGRLTTEFGQTRYVNDAPTSSRHSGLDIAAVTGTTIVATNRGKVVLAMPLILTGNTIVIDHGEGLFSVYYHMHELFVEVGDVVERGQSIGAVGTTGFSTGPHLHFMISYYAMNIEPGFFLVGQPITFANYRDFLD